MSTNATSPQAPTSNALSALGEALDAASVSVGHARADATQSAKLAAAKVQSGVSVGAYYSAYGISYSVVFTGVFIKELFPLNNPIRRGFEDGAVAAIDAAESRRLALQSGDHSALEESSADASARKPT